MATQTPILGKSLTLKIGSPTALEISNLRSSSLAHSADTIDVTTKDSGEYKEYLAVFKDMTFDFEGITTEAGTNSIDDLHLKVGTKVGWEFGTGESGSRRISGEGIIVSIDEDAPYEDVSTFSGSVQNTGDPVFDTYD